MFKAATVGTDEGRRPNVTTQNVIEINYSSYFSNVQFVSALFSF
jgi:hypothetical protein